MAWLKPCPFEGVFVSHAGVLGICGEKVLAGVRRSAELQVLRLRSSRLRTASLRMTEFLGGLGIRERPHIPLDMY
jgi:hypothetical protein